MFIIEKNNPNKIIRRGEERFLQMDKNERKKI